MQRLAYYNHDPLTLPCCAEIEEACKKLDLRMTSRRDTGQAWTEQDFSRWIAECRLAIFHNSPAITRASSLVMDGEEWLSDSRNSSRDGLAVAFISSCDQPQQNQRVTFAGSNKRIAYRYLFYIPQTFQTGLCVLRKKSDREIQKAVVESWTKLLQLMQNRQVLDSYFKDWRLVLNNKTKKQISRLETFVDIARSNEEFQLLSMGIFCVGYLVVNGQANCLDISAESKEYLTSLSSGAERREHLQAYFSDYQAWRLLKDDQGQSLLHGDHSQKDLAQTLIKPIAPNAKLVLSILDKVGKHMKYATLRTEWQGRRDKLNHDFLKNRYLNRLNGFMLRLRDSAVGDPRLLDFLKDDFPLVDPFLSQVELLIKDFEEAMSPQTFFGTAPLNRIDPVVGAWLRSLVHNLWIRELHILDLLGNCSSLVKEAKKQFVMVSSLVMRADLRNLGHQVRREEVSEHPIDSRLYSAFEFHRDVLQRLSFCLSALPRGIRII